MNVQQNSQMPMEVHFACYMKTILVLDAVFVTVPILNKQKHMHVYNIKTCGLNMCNNIVVSIYLVSKEFYNNLEKDSHGNLHYNNIHSYMIRKWQKPKDILILAPIAFIVLKQSVHPVRLLLHGLSLQNLNHQPIFYGFWTLYIPLRIPGQIMFALIKPAFF